MQMDLEELISLQEDTPANRSPSPGSEKAVKMTDISGQRCLQLSRLSGPLGSLEKTLLATSAWASTKCFLTWRPKATPQGRLLFQLVPLMPRTDETGFGLWQTPNATMRGGNQTQGSQLSLIKQVNGWKKDGTQMWPTPRANSAMAATLQPYMAERFKNYGNLEEAVALTMFPTPASRDYKGARKPDTMAQTGRNPETNSLPDAVEFKGASGRLNPAFVEWLMGYPTGYTDLDH